MVDRQYIKWGLTKFLLTEFYQQSRISQQNFLRILTSELEQCVWCLVSFLACVPHNPPWCTFQTRHYLSLKKYYTLPQTTENEPREEKWGQIHNRTKGVRCPYNQIAFRSCWIFRDVFWFVCPNKEMPLINNHSLKYASDVRYFMGKDYSLFL